MKKHKIIEVFVSHENFYELLEGSTLDDVGMKLHELKTTYEGRDVFFRIDSWDNDKQLELWERRIETDQECNDRIAREKKDREIKAKNAKANKADEYKEYLRLKKKFGDKE